MSLEETAKLHLHRFRRTKYVLPLAAGCHTVCITEILELEPPATAAPRWQLPLLGNSSSMCSCLSNGNQSIGNRNHNPVRYAWRRRRQPWWQVASVQLTLDDNATERHPTTTGVTYAGGTFVTSHTDIQERRWRSGEIWSISSARRNLRWWLGLDAYRYMTTTTTTAAIVNWVKLFITRQRVQSVSQSVSRGRWY